MSGTYDPNGPLRVAYLTYRGKPHVGGQGVYTRHLTKALADLGHTVEVFGGQPYPVLDDRITMHKLPSLDIFNDAYPGRMPAYWEIKTWPDFVETARYMTGQFSEPLAFSKRALRTLTPRVNDFDLVHDNQCLGWDILKIEKIIPTIVTLHHPITKDRELEMSHAPSRWKRRSVGRWYSFVEMQGKVASKMPRIVVVSENSITDINKDMGVSRDRMRLVPVGVDPDLFKPLPHIAREPGRLITTASADVALKGLSYLLEAMAILRKDRDIRLTIIGKPRPGHSMDLIDSLGLRPHIDFVSGVTDERIVELYAEAELAVVPSLYEGFSLPAIEAMSTGICLVATDGGALPEVTGTHNETVLQCPAANAEALATSIATGLDSAELRDRIGEAGRQRVLTRGRWKHCAELTFEQYREVLDMPHNRAKLEKRR
jgi:glycosyltransferase involved in cell wall biosynthesis